MTSRERVQSIFAHLGRARVYLLLIVVFAVMAALAPRFLTVDNQIALLKKASIHMIPAIGFTLVLAIGQLDLSFASVMTLGGMLTLGFQPRFGWIGGLAAAAACGLGIGLANGLLVSKARVSSFIVTLGTLTIVQGVVNIYSHGNTLRENSHRYRVTFECLNISGIQRLRVSASG